jgi:hypothetical protein
MALVERFIPSDSSELEEGIRESFAFLGNMLKENMSVHQRMYERLTELLDDSELDYDGMMKKTFYNRKSLTLDGYMAAFLTNLREGAGEFQPLFEYLNGSEKEVIYIVTDGVMPLLAFYCALGRKMKSKAELLGIVKKEWEMPGEDWQEHPVGIDWFSYTGQKPK